MELVGGPCGQHGPYTFYKAFKFSKNGERRILTLSEFFFVKLWIDSDLLCIGELQLLWADKNSEQVLASLRLYFLPENTPEGRLDHGEDEVLAISEKVVLRVEDLVTWITVDTEWSWGRLAKRCAAAKASTLAPPSANATVTATSPYSNELHELAAVAARLTDSSLDFSDVERERKLIENVKVSSSLSRSPAVIILSYPRYCRYRALMKRLEGVEDEHLKNKIVYALGGVNVKTSNTRILFCKDTFDYPELEGHEMLCNHLAPKLKGRPRGKRKKRSISPGSESNESESSVSNAFTTSKSKLAIDGRNGLRFDSSTPPPTTRRSTRATEITESKDFIKRLNAFMKRNRTPIGRIPSLGYKELDLYSFFSKVQKLGGYDSVTTARQWKAVFDDLSGNQSSTSAATVIRRHYERFLLPYERHVRGEEYKPLPVSERRRLKSKTGGSTSTSDAETSESASRSGNSTPIPQLQPAPSLVDNKEMQIKIEVGKSSLRSVRVKSDRSISREGTSKEVVECKEPQMDAVAPIQKLSIEKSTSPAEGKENIPIFNDVGKQPQSDDDLIEIVPYNPKTTPEIIDLVDDKYNNNNNQLSNNNTSTTILEVKKGKLDILKEGGLEVTPVRHSMQRPSVIQENVMPPPSINATLIRRLPTSASSQPPPPVQITKKQSTYTAAAAATVVASSPPKVVQSKSIYTPSQRKVYGDPKDLFSPPIHHVQSPKFVNKPPTDLLDLTLRSPQKPVVEIMRVPPPKTANSAALPLLEGRRMNSNLEITLIGPPSTKRSLTATNEAYTPPSSKHLKLEEAFLRKQQQQAIQTAPYYHPHHHHHYQQQQQQPSIQKTAPTQPPQIAPPPAPYLHLMDPMYLQALQNICQTPPTATSTLPPPPMFPLTSGGGADAFHHHMYNRIAAFNYPAAAFNVHERHGGHKGGGGEGAPATLTKLKKQ